MLEKKINRTFQFTGQTVDSAGLIPVQPISGLIDRTETVIGRRLDQPIWSGF